MLQAGRLAAHLVHAVQLRAQIACPTASRAISLSHLSQLCLRSSATQAAQQETSWSSQTNAVPNNSLQQPSEGPSGGDRDTIAAIVTGVWLVSLLLCADMLADSCSAQALRARAQWPSYACQAWRRSTSQAASFRLASGVPPLLPSSRTASTTGTCATPEAAFSTR